MRTRRQDEEARGQADHATTAGNHHVATLQSDGGRIPRLRPGMLTQKGRFPNRSIITVNLGRTSSRSYRGLNHPNRVGALATSVRALIPSFPSFPRTGRSSQQQRLALASLTDNPHVMAIAMQPVVDIPAFFATLFDWAQSILGYCDNPKASEYAMEIKSNCDELDIHVDKLYQLGLYFDLWETPLTAARLQDFRRDREGGLEEDTEEAPLQGGPTLVHVTNSNAADDDVKPPDNVAGGTAAEKQVPPLPAGRQSTLVKPDRRSTIAEEPVRGDSTPFRTRGTPEGDKDSAPRARKRRQDELESTQKDGKLSATLENGQNAHKRRMERRTKTTEGEEIIDSVNPGPDVLPNMAQPEGEDQQRKARSVLTSKGLDAGAAAEDELPAVTEDAQAEEQEDKGAGAKRAANARRQPHRTGRSDGTGPATKTGERTLHYLDAEDKDEENQQHDIEEPSPRRRKQQRKQSGNVTSGPPGSGHGRPAAAVQKEDASSPPNKPCYWLDRKGPKELHWAGANVLKRPRSVSTSAECTSCHVCQAQHIVHRCCKEGCLKSFCLKCSKNFVYLYDYTPGDPLEELLQQFCDGICPCCLTICNQPRCMRQHRYGAKHHLPPAPLLPAERHELAVRMVSYLKEPVRALLKAGEQLLQRYDVSTADTIQSAIVNGEESIRLLCNRCATCLEDVHVHCPSCEADYCPACCADLAGQGLAAGGGSGHMACMLCGNEKTVLKRVLNSKMLQQLEKACSPIAPQAVDQEKQANDADPGGETHEGAATTFAPLHAVQVTIAGERRRNSPALSHSKHLKGPLQLHMKKHTLQSTGTTATSTVTQDNATASAGAQQEQQLQQQQQQQQVVRHGVATQEVRALEAMAAYLDVASSHLNDPSGRQVLQAVRDAVVGGRLRLPSTTPRTTELLRVLRCQGPLLDSQLSLDAPSRSSPGALSAPAEPLMNAGPSQTAAAAWFADLPPEDYRLASRRPDKSQNYIWTPHVRDFARESHRHSETVQRFRQRWAAGEPIVVRGFRGKLQWGPDDVMRAARDMGRGEKDLPVIDCEDWASMREVPAARFFNRYRQCHGPSVDPLGEQMTMLKLKDFPPDEEFRYRCRRHHDDFLEMLNSCMPEYCHPEGFMNLASTLPESYLPPDLGPKGYIAFGREDEHLKPGDSVTRLHKDLSDAINILCHVQRPPSDNKTRAKPRCGDALWEAPGFGGAGALWDLWRREDLPTLRRFLEDVIAGQVENCPPFYYAKDSGPVRPSDVTDVVHDQCFMLTEAHRAVLAEKYGVHSWMIEQYEWESVFIPAGCAHQVRNLRACIKIALDFVSPESVPTVLMQREEIRQLAMKELPQEKLTVGDDPAERHFADKLQVANMVLFGLGRAADALADDGSGK